MTPDAGMRTLNILDRQRMIRAILDGTMDREAAASQYGVSLAYVQRVMVRARIDTLISDEDVETIRTMTERGAQQQEIERVVGISTGRRVQVLDALGLPHQKRGRRREIAPDNFDPDDTSVTQYCPTCKRTRPLREFYFRRRRTVRGTDIVPIASCRECRQRYPSQRRSATSEATL